MLLRDRLKLVIVSQYGRLGNKLWTYANVLAFAIEHKFIVSNPEFVQWKTSFELSLDEANPTEVRKKARNSYPDICNTGLSYVFKVNRKINIVPSIELLDGERLDLDFVDTTKLENHRIAFLSGLYFTAPRSLYKHAALVRSYFKPVDSIRREVNDLLNFARDKIDVLIGVHIRHGDYRTFCNGNMYYEVSEYADVMRSLKEQFPGQKVGFVICSDEEQDFSNYSDLQTFHRTGGVVQDLYTLSQCNYIFGPNSTFSHWASFFGEVPLHILNWKTEENGLDLPFYPSIEKHFRIFPSQDGNFPTYMFGYYRRKDMKLEDVISSELSILRVS